MPGKSYSLVCAAMLLFACPTQSEAGRRGLRVDLGAWNEAHEIVLGAGNGACPEAGWDAEVPVFEPAPTILWGWVTWNDLEFRTSAFEGLNSFYCQTSRAYQPGALPEEYLNQAIFPADEADLGALIGDNEDNAVSALRYSFLGDHSGFPLYGRQWAFYFFPNQLTVVALHGVEDNQPTYEWIWDKLDLVYVFNAQINYWDGEYFCFDGRSYIGDCVTPPPPPEQMFLNGFE